MALFSPVCTVCKRKLRHHHVMSEKDGAWGLCEKRCGWMSCTTCKLVYPSGGLGKPFLAGLFVYNA